MRHRKKGRKFGRVRKTRKALVRSLLRSLVERGRIKTTLPKAKEIRSAAEKLITKAKGGSLAEKRSAGAVLTPKQTAKLFALAASFKERKGGYTRITRVNSRKGDAAEIAVLEFIK